MKPNGYFETYRGCSCMSETVAHKSELLGYCRFHLTDRRQILPDMSYKESPRAGKPGRPAWQRKRGKPGRVAGPATAGQFVSVRAGAGRRKRVNQISDRQRKRNAEYAKLAIAYKLANPKCLCCGPIFSRPARATSDVHHQKGKQGKLLTDTRYFTPTCRECHEFIHRNPEHARNLGLLANMGQWNRQQD